MVTCYSGFSVSPLQLDWICRPSTSDWALYQTRVKDPDQSENQSLERTVLFWISSFIKGLRWPWLCCSPSSSSNNNRETGFSSTLKMMGGSMRWRWTWQVCVFSLSVELFTWSWIETYASLQQNPIDTLVWLILLVNITDTEFWYGHMQYVNYKKMRYRNSKIHL